MDYDGVSTSDSDLYPQSLGEYADLYRFLVFSSKNKINFSEFSDLIDDKREMAILMKNSAELKKIGSFDYTSG